MPGNVSVIGSQDFRSNINLKIIFPKKKKLAKRLLMIY